MTKDGLYYNRALNQFEFWHSSKSKEKPIATISMTKYRQSGYFELWSKKYLGFVPHFAIDDVSGKEIRVGGAGLLAVPTQGMVG